MPHLQAQAQRQVWALDFDGVVCDSVGESAIASWTVGWFGGLRVSSIGPLPQPCDIDNHLCVQ